MLKVFLISSVLLLAACAGEPTRIASASDTPSSASRLPPNASVTRVNHDDPTATAVCLSLAC